MPVSRDRTFAIEWTCAEPSGGLNGFGEILLKEGGGRLTLKVRYPLRIKLLSAAVASVCLLLIVVLMSHAGCKKETCVGALVAGIWFGFLHLMFGGNSERYTLEAKKTSIVVTGQGEWVRVLADIERWVSIKGSKQSHRRLIAMVKEVFDNVTEEG